MKDKVIILNDQGGGIMNVSENVTATLRAQDHGHPPLILALDYHPHDSRIGVKDEDVCQSLTSRMGTGGNNVPMVLMIYDEDIC